MGRSPARAKVDQYALKIIRHKSQQFVGKAGFGTADREDIEQELVLDLVRRLPRFDATRASERTFMARVVDHGAATLAAAQAAGVRDYRRRAGSIEDPAFFCEEPSSDDEEQLGRRLDIARVLRRLPEEDRRLCEQLAVYSENEIASATGSTRYRLAEARARLRRRFERAGLRDYA